MVIGERKTGACDKVSSSVGNAMKTGSIVETRYAAILNHVRDGEGPGWYLDLGEYPRPCSPQLNIEQEAHVR